MHTQPRRTRPSPRHPARHVTEPMAGLLACGSVRSAAFPSASRRLSGIGQALAAYSCGGSRGLESVRPARAQPVRTTFPHRSLLARETIDPRQYTVASPRCQWVGARFRVLRSPSVASTCGCCSRRDALLCPPLSGVRRWLRLEVRRVKREAGALRKHYSGTAPATVSESFIRESGDRPGID